MSKQSVLETRNKLAKIYVAGILVFSAIVGFITLLAKFLAHVNVM